MSDKKLYRYVFQANDTPDLPEKSLPFLLVTMTIYVAAVFSGILLHPMWRDEIHPWLITRASRSLSDLLQQKSLEGHPDLWYVFIYGLNLVTSNPMYMQLLHGCIAAVTAFLVLKYAPFARFQRLLLVSGYFFLFEYAVISRNYAIGILLVILILTLSRRNDKNILIRAFLIALLAQSNVFGLILGIALVMTWGLDYIAGRKKHYMKADVAAISAGLMLIVVAMAWSVRSIIPPETSFFSGSAEFSHEELTLKEFIRSLGIVWQAWVPIPEISLRFWNTNIIRSDIVQAIFSVILLGVTGSIFRKRKGILFLLFTGTTGIILFVLAFYYGYTRHHGHLFILLVVCFWLDRLLPTMSNQPNTSPLNGQRFFTGILIIHLLVGITASVIHMAVPFSAGKMTATYITKHRLDRFLLAGDQDVGLETVTGYLDREAWFFSRGRMSRYLVYDDHRKSHEAIHLQTLADSLMIKHNDTVLLVMNYPITTDPAGNITPLAQFTRSIQRDEIYYLYLMMPENKAMQNNFYLPANDIVNPSDKP